MVEAERVFFDLDCEAVGFCCEENRGVGANESFLAISGPRCSASRALSFLASDKRAERRREAVFLALRRDDPDPTILFLGEVILRFVNRFERRTRELDAR